eukprot:5114351-Amphidinium_carterae.1
MKKHPIIQAHKFRNTKYGRPMALLGNAPSLPLQPSYRRNKSSWLRSTKPLSRQLTKIINIINNCARFTGF